LYNLAKEVIQRMKEESFFGKTVTVKVKYSDFKIVTRSKTFPHRITDFYFLWDSGKNILKQIDLSQKKIRLLGLGVSNAVSEPDRKYTQLDLF
jgi:DNA polymerase-4